MKKLFGVVSALLLFVAFAQADDQSTLATVEGGADLEKVKYAKFRETYVNTGADFTRYNKLYLGDAYFDYRDVGEPKRYRSNMYSSSSKSFFGISKEDREKFEKMTDEAFTKELSKSKRFTITDNLDENTILMRGAVIDIVSKVPPQFVGRSEVYLASVGAATLVLELLDGKTGEVLARVAERRTMGSPGGQIDMMSMPTNSVTVWSDVRRWASGSARRLRSELDEAASGE
ncbi:MAG: DUF3313 family protein [Halioglobus sp.]